MSSPASTSSVLPVISSARSLTQNTTTRAMSSGTATRPSGSCAAELVEREARGLEAFALSLEPGRERHGRRDREDADAVRAELDREALREPADAELRRDVVRHPGPLCAIGGRRGDRHDHTTTALIDHHAGGLASAQEGATEVDVRGRRPTDRR